MLFHFSAHRFIETKKKGPLSESPSYMQYKIYTGWLCYFAATAAIVAHCFTAFSNDAVVTTPFPAIS